MVADGQKMRTDRRMDKGMDERMNDAKTISLSTLLGDFVGG